MYNNEQKIRKDLESKILDFEIDLKKKSEEIDGLQFNNSRLTKRVENLMTEVNSHVITYYFIMKFSFFLKENAKILRIFRRFVVRKTKRIHR